ncbi:MAG: hypothetical protein K0R90_218 [Oscillospiraceae bacterium]|jgi:hypothetical protein|nr:hypothetical protein [Oscillospiraceae bacterium]
MRGLLIKDLINLKSYGKTVLITIGFFIAFSIVTKNTSMVTTMVIMYASMLPITSITFDERAKWERFALAMPIPREHFVISKYLLGLIMMLSGIIITSLVNMGITFTLGNENDMRTSILTLLTMTVFGVLYLSAILPVIFKMGVEKARIIMIGILIIPSVLIILLAQSSLPILSRLKSLQITPLFILIIILSVMIAVTISISASIKIFSKREF